MQMIRIAIVDDESLVRVGFQTIIDWNANGFEIHGVYRNGKEAWNAFLVDGYPDVLMTDIRMPEMDGLELIRKIRQIDDQMIILVLSSYEEIEYFRTSMKLGVQDYIPKHLFDPDELIETIKRSLDKAKPKTEKPAAPNRTEAMQLENQLLMTNSRMLPGIIKPAGEITKTDFPWIAARLGNAEEVRWITIREVFAAGVYLATDLSALTFLLQDLMEKTNVVIPIGVDQGTFHALLICRPSVSEHQVSDLIQEWADTVKQNLAISVVAGVSAIAEFSQSKLIRSQAERMLDLAFFYGPGIYWFTPETLLKMPQDGVMRADWQEKIGELVKESSDKLIKWVCDSKQSLSRQCTPDETFLLIRWAYKAYMHKMIEGSILNLEADLYGNKAHQAFESAGVIPSWDALIKLFSQAIEACEDSLSLNRQVQPWLRPVLAFVEEHYREPIRLEDAASVVNLNVNYFSHRFSQEIGITFLDYLTRLRIHKSKQLIARYRLSAEEAASRVGYPNASYFVKVFKKVTGMTVSEFKHTSEKME